MVRRGSAVRAGWGPAWNGESRQVIKLNKERKWNV
jgi:hypothetical protein